MEWLVSCNDGFQSICKSLMEKNKRIMEASWWERLKGKLGLVLMGGAMLSKSLIQFSVDGWGCVPSLFFTWCQNMVEVMKIMVSSFKRSHECTAILSAPNPAAGHHRPTPLLETPGHSQQARDSLLWGHYFFLQVLAHKVLLCPPRVYFPVLCKLWQLYGGVNDNLLQEGLCHTQVCCTQSPCPCSRPPLTGTSTADAQTQFCLGLCGVPGS